MKKLSLISILITIFFTYLSGQNKVVVSDGNNILNDEIEELITENLKRNNLEYTTVMDFRNHCDYYLGSLVVKNNEAFITLMDCENKEIGTKNLGTGFLTARNQEKAILLSFAITDIAGNPGRYTSVVPSERPSSEERSILTEKPITVEKTIPETPSPGEAEHSSRYFFAPSAYNLKKGELYYNTIYFLLHDIQYGVSDNFSIGMGTTIAGMPFYITPKITVPAGEKSTIGVGDMMMLGTWGSDFFGNLFYGVYTYGTHNKNISLGTGVLSTNESDITGSNNSLVLNLSAMARTSGFVYFVTENYGFRVSRMQDAYRWNPDYIYETYEQNQTLIYGLTGLRFVNKTNDVVCWQFGLSYVWSFFGEIPERYTYGGWETYAEDGGSKFITIPTVSYTKKFGKKF